MSRENEPTMRGLWCKEPCWECGEEGYATRTVDKPKDEPYICGHCHALRVANEDADKRKAGLHAKHNCFNDDAVAERLTHAESRANENARKLDTALANVSGALVDSGVEVPSDPAMYGEAVRELTGERDAAIHAGSCWEDNYNTMLDANAVSERKNESIKRELLARVGILEKQRDTAVKAAEKAERRVTELEREWWCEGARSNTLLNLLRRVRDACKHTTAWLGAELVDEVNREIDDEEEAEAENRSGMNLVLARVAELERTLEAVRGVEQAGALEGYADADPAMLLFHLTQETGFDSEKIEGMLLLAKRASRALLNTTPTPAPEEEDDD